MVSCQAKNTAIVQQMGQLDKMIDEEKNKWKQRLEREKAAMTNRIANMYKNRADDTFGDGEIAEDSKRE